MTFRLSKMIGVAALAAAAPAAAADVSTHILDLVRGVGGKGVPVTLSEKGPDGRWIEVARGTTDDNGRVRDFGKPVDVGTYKLHFDMSGYPTVTGTPFFPEIDLTFRVADKSQHYHVPVVVSPFGYSTYRGN